MSSSPSRFQLRGGRPPKISCSSAASNGPHHTMAELVQCSLINCWSHVQNVTRGRWPSMPGRSDGPRKRRWSGLPAPNAVIRKKGILAALTPNEKARSSTKLQAAVSRAHCLRVRPKTSGMRGLAMRREHSWLANPDALSPGCSSSKLICPRLFQPTGRPPTGCVNARPVTGSAKQSVSGWQGGLILRFRLPPSLFELRRTRSLVELRRTSRSSNDAKCEHQSERFEK